MVSPVPGGPEHQDVRDNIQRGGQPVRSDCRDRHSGRPSRGGREDLLEPRQPGGGLVLDGLAAYPVASLSPSPEGSASGQWPVQTGSSERAPLLPASRTYHRARPGTHTHP
jgi:hypothetical protein